MQVLHSARTGHPRSLSSSQHTLRALDPADIKSIQCVVGRVEDRGKWGLVDRSGPLAHAVFAEAN